MSKNKEIIMKTSQETDSIARKVTTTITNERVLIRVHNSMIGLTPKVAKDIASFIKDNISSLNHVNWAKDIAVMLDDGDLIEAKSMLAFVIKESEWNQYANDVSI